MKIGFIGVGIMGGPICRRLLAARHEVSVFDVSAEAARSVESAGARVATCAADAVRGAEIVFTSLPTPAVVEATALGDDGIYRAMSRGAVHVELSTIGPDTARRLAAGAGQAGVLFLDAPVSGGPSGAEAGTLSVMVGGELAIFESVKPVLAAFARPDRLYHCGPTGSAAVTKLANNLVEIATNVLLAEAFGMAVAAGVSPRVVYDVMCNSSAQCRLLGDWGESILRGDFDSAKNATLDIVAKDIRLATDLGRSQGIPMEVTNLVDQCLVEARRRGWGPESMTVVGRLQEERVGTVFRFETARASSEEVGAET